MSGGSRWMRQTRSLLDGRLASTCMVLRGEAAAGR